MNEIFLIVADYFKGKSIYPSFRKLASLLFNISIASFIFEMFYGEYAWLNYNDYKGILNFFIKGNFFIPFSIFIAVWSVSQFIALIIFTSINHFQTLKLTREIVYYQIKKETIDKNLKQISKASRYATPIRITKGMMIEMYQQLKNELTPELYQKMETELKIPKENLEANFILVFRAFIAITIYFLSIQQFGWILFTITSIVLICSLYIIMLSYRLLDVFPTLIRKFHALAEKYLKEHEPK